MAIGFVGLGIMGTPMALRLLRAGTDLVVWNRSPHRCGPLERAGARIAADPAEVFDSCSAVILMLSDEAAADAVLGRTTEGEVAVGVAGRTVVHMGTIAPAASRSLGADIEAAGGRYVEAPVSGSRGPAEEGTLVAMLAGDPEPVAEAARIIAPLCADQVVCGPVPAALTLKLAVNTFLITLVTGLAEAFHFAERQGLDPGLLARVLDAGPMASAVSRAKADKLVSGDFAPQAAVTDVFKNSRLVVEAARAAGAAAPLMEACLRAFADADRSGHGGRDMAAVIEALRAADPGPAPERAPAPAPPPSGRG
ncbi:NAD(P)-dependent oxidoreductase [Nocardiopsis changdeensis]|uniref:NAD(P)-dependent oxidoreductase n=1 Tax=Nocardiopsis changdeensis TaxID=2831969 RepID=UPI003F479822